MLLNEHKKINGIETHLDITKSMALKHMTFECYTFHKDFIYVILLPHPVL